MKHRDAVVSIVSGILLSASILLLLTGLAAKMLVDGKIEEGNIVWLAPLLLFVASVIGCIFASGARKDEIRIPLWITVANLMIVTCCSFLLNGPFQSVWSSLLAVLFGCVIACVICMKKPARNIKRKKRYR